MIRKLLPTEIDRILEVINDGAQAYKGIIPADRWKEPYMSADELEGDLKAGLTFFGWEENDVVLGVMGIQPVEDTTLIRHAYVRTDYQGRGIGSRLLEHLLQRAKTTEILTGTWAAAIWAIRFYEKYGFILVSRDEKDKLLRRYWRIPERQVETSVVLRLKK
ncbi:MAG: N-acetyltransferase [Methanophagales archaeon ANME-1-THS]|nr:MAG: N-acetyltransferase [Methanophagales archaeon ANME-1-THS]